MKKKTAKQPKQSKRTVKDLKPKKDTKGGTTYGRGSFAIRLSDPN